MKVLSSGRLPSPIPTSQAAGATSPMGLAMTAEGSPPGFGAGDLVQPVTVDPLAAEPAELPVAVPSEAGLPRRPAGTPDGGQFLQADREDAGDSSPWRPTPAAS